MTELLNEGARLAAVLAEFEEYIDTPAAWSDRAMRRFRAVFATYGVEGLTADDLIAAAKKTVLRLRSEAEGRNRG